MTELVTDWLYILPNFLLYNNTISPLSPSLPPPLPLPLSLPTPLPLSLCHQLGDVLSVVFGELSKLPRYLIPCYFEAVISLIYNMLTQSAVNKMGK